MGKFGSNQCGFLLIDGYDVLGVTTQIEDNVEALIEETTALGDTWQEHEYTNIRRASIAQEGFFDDAAGSSNAALVAGPGTSRVLCYNVEGNTIGKKFVGYSGAMQAKYVRVASRGELHKANAEYQGNGVVEEGKILHAHGAETAASGNTQASSVDNGASSSAGGSGYLQANALTLGGYTNVVVKVQHSADNVVFADLITFTAVTAAPTAERKTVAGTVNRYLAASWAFTGAGAGQSVTFLTGFKRN